MYCIYRKYLGIAHQLWPAAVLLCDYIGDHPDFLVDLIAEHPLHVVELGSGIGLCGLFVASLFKHRYPTIEAKVVLTDLSCAMEGSYDSIIAYRCRK